MLYWLLKPVGIMIMFSLFKIRVSGQDRVPHGSVIIAANHDSYFDPIILSGVFKKPIHFMAKTELFSHRFGSWFLRQLHAIPVDRKSGIVIRPVRQALNTIEQGELFGIFPEGTRCKPGETVRPKKGVAFLGRKTEVPIVPVTIIKGKKVLWRRPVKVVIGEAIAPGDFPSADDEWMSRYVMAQIRERSEDEELEWLGKPSEN
ncbi:lysophospholipid acyltransferase family protein [Natribacillus halophilus]|uniref:1-acyl-sn-glycerol-3-phosphate acyltransferase n=1 Tax=Natribacillus halophilus TaxID=549003 RepID=A0A1G8J9H3_9BACI|nr:lysophospholipid acyltransferase family protein [Natribacillus halophilus]SDI27300.1 1-acyl-sn-glycerol-3-phosphate acyltransferase [Natribacillus halophilus]